jgi:hypothetical protein
VKGGVKIREAKATTLKRVLLARSCAMWAKDVVGEVKGVDEVGVRVECRGARSRGDRRSEIEVDPKCRGLRHDMSDLALESVEESRAFGEDKSRPPGRAFGGPPGCQTAKNRSPDNIFQKWRSARTMHNGVGPWAKGPVGSPVSFPKRSNQVWRLVASPSPCQINTKSKHQTVPPSPPRGAPPAPGEAQELLALPMIVVEEQAKELGVDVAEGAEDGGQERDTMIVSVGMLILMDFLLGGFTQRLVDVGLVSKLAGLGRIVRRPQRSWVMKERSKTRSPSSRGRERDVYY